MEFLIYATKICLMGFTEDIFVQMDLSITIACT